MHKQNRSERRRHDEHVEDCIPRLVSPLLCPGTVHQCEKWTSWVNFFKKKLLEKVLLIFPFTKVYIYSIHKSSDSYSTKIYFERCKFRFVYHEMKAAIEERYMNSEQKK